LAHASGDHRQALRSQELILLTKRTYSRVAVTLAAILAVARPATAGPAFGLADDVAYAAALWRAMVTARLVGPDERELEPFFGGAKPHGEILELAYQNLEVNGHTGFIVVKKNYDGPSVSEEAVARDRARYLTSITVMFERETGYDPDNQNWFWVKYKPDGGLDTREMGEAEVPLAGRIAKGAPGEESRGCIYCHSSAGGRDYIFYPRVKRP
jgi:hypothetical protein